MAAVQTVKGLSNSRGGASLRREDPEFVQLVKPLRRIQESASVGLRADVTKDKKGERPRDVFCDEKGSTGDSEEMEAVKRLLGLSREKTEFSVVYGAAPDRDDVIALHTRSGFQILYELATFVEVPEAHEREQRAYPHLPTPPVGQETPSAVDSYRERRNEADGCLRQGVL